VSEVIKMLIKEEIKCDICDKAGFKSKAGLAGHKKIAHGEDRRKTVPDEIGKHLEDLASGLKQVAKAVVDDREVIMSLVHGIVLKDLYDRGYREKKSIDQIADFIEKEDYSDLISAYGHGKYYTVLDEHQKKLKERK